ncbi:MAG TPA: hypothetical protein VFZ10_12630 [Geminicoccaceae bacterium]
MTLAIRGDDLVADQQARTLDGAAVADGSEEHPPRERGRHHADAGVSHLPFGEELS